MIISFILLRINFYTKRNCTKYLFTFIMEPYFGDSPSKNHFIKTWM